MQQQAVYDLLVAKPHEPDDARFTDAEFAVHRAAYYCALVMALKVMDAATRRYQLRVRTKRLEARTRRDVPAGPERTAR